MLSCDDVEFVCVCPLLSRHGASDADDDEESMTFVMVEFSPPR